MTKVICECGNTYNTSYEKRHMSSKVHNEYLENLSDKTDTVNKSDNDDENYEPVDEVDDNFLDELNNENYIIEDEPIKEIREPTFNFSATVERTSLFFKY